MGRDDCPECGGSLTPTVEKERISNASHSIRIFRCGECGREVGR